MMNLSNPISQQALHPSMLDKEPFVNRIGYSVRIDPTWGERIVHLLPAWDSIGFGAQVGERVEISSVGCGVQGVVIARIEGYSSQACKQTPPPIEGGFHMLR